LKRGTIGPQSFLLNAGPAGNDDSIDFAGDRIRFYLNGGVTGGKFSEALYRDPSAWYHFVFVCDLNNATAANRMQIWVNGVRLTAFTYSVDPPSTYNTIINNNQAQEIGARAGIETFDGYLTEINFVDGQALTPSSFGEFNALTGVWQPKSYAGTYGTNGFYLNFKDNASTSALGTDYSGRGNNWTTNNISLTAGATFDSMIDVPTPYDDGGNGRGNYAVLNPLNVGGGTVSNGNLQWAVSSGTGLICTATMGFDIADTTNKYYWEMTLSSGEAVYGIAPLTLRGTDTNRAGSYGYYVNGNKFFGTSGSANGASFTSGDVIGVAVGAGKITFYKNGVSQGDAFTGLTGTFVPFIAEVITTTIANFGQRPFAYTPPTGFKALNTQNLPEPTIVDGGKHFDALVWSGTGSNQQLPLDFTADFVWAKRRDGGDSHRLYDVIRGENQDLISNSTAAEATNDLGLDFIGHNYIEVEGAKYFGGGGGSTSFVAWNWKANGAGVTNTAGSITSTVSANPTAGFSIVTWTGDNNADSRVGHGLGVTPQIVIMKTRSDSSPWYFQTSIIDGSFDVLLLNTTNAKVDIGGAYTPPTSTTFTNYGPWGGTTLVAYCFAEVAGYSRFGRYTGNGSADGPFVFCGFRPRFVMFKRTNDTSSWLILDTARNTVNVMGAELYADVANAENNAFAIADFVSNGFKIRIAGGAGINTGGSTYIFMAFAENPFKNALAR
jgi:hypothetical protein